jgi:hypothetical protein
MHSENTVFGEEKLHDHSRSSFVAIVKSVVFRYPGSVACSQIGDIRLAVVRKVLRAGKALSSNPMSPTPDSPPCSAICSS